MIGTNIRGIRHLWRVSDTSLKKILVRSEDGSNVYDICYVIKTPQDSKIGERMFIFNQWYNSTDYSKSYLCGLSDDLNKELSKIENLSLLQFNEKDAIPMYFNDIVLLPDSFDDDYEQFLKENSKMVKELSQRYCVDDHDIIFKRLYIYTNGSKNFFQWGVNLFYKSACTMATIYNILLWNECYKQLTKHLSKGTITAYTSSNDILKLIRELNGLRKEKRIADAINSFNTAQKKLLRENGLSSTDKTTLAKFSKLSETKKINFIQKVSTIGDFSELMRQMRHVTSIHFEWSKESLMDFLKNVEGIDYEIIYENDHVVLVKVLDYETIKQLGKTTNWCISKNKTYWNNYIENTRGESTQYMIFDFSKLEDDHFSIVGFTTTINKGITAAHNFVNDELVSQSRQNNQLFLKSFLSRFNSNSDGIYKVLSDCDIDINLVINYETPQYEWSHDGLMGYLYECVDRDNVDVIKDDDNKLVLSVCDENIKYFFGDSYMENMEGDVCEMQHIIFADFSMNQHDPNRIIFGIIEDNNGSNEYCYAMFNAAIRNINNNFDAQLSKFGVPYNIIKRPNNVAQQIKSAFFNYDTFTLRECIKKDPQSLHKVLTSTIHTHEFYEVLQTSIIEYLSFDYINLIYDSGHFISDYLDVNTFAKMLKYIFNQLFEVSRTLYRNYVMELPNEERIEAFYNEAINNRNDVRYIGYYLILKKIILSETPQKTIYDKIYLRVIASLCDFRLTGTLPKELIYLLLDKIDMKTRNDCAYYAVKYLALYGDDEMFNTLNALMEKHQWIASEVHPLLERRKNMQKQGVLEAASVACDLDSPF